jgi:hypothetical protein
MKNYSRTLNLERFLKIKNEFKNQGPKRISSFAIHQESLKGK